jgi:peptidyl-prolyl cis-trans isomerase B (cyclophilin B)
MIGSVTRRADGVMPPAEGGAPALETLEPRLHLSGSVAELGSPDHTVVQVRLPFSPFADESVVQIELLDDEAPEAAAAFLAAVREGHLDETFFHRYVPGSVLEGGAFRWDSVRGLEEVEARVVEVGATPRGNTAWTVALVPGEGGALGNRFIINLGDNSAEFDALGYIVFGVVLESSRATLDAYVSSVTPTDVSGSPLIPEAWAGELVAVPWNAMNFAGGPPVAFNGLEERMLHVRDIEVIKAAQADRFYSSFTWYPEGFAGATISEFLPIMNPNDEGVYYQVVARFETGLRDRVIAEGYIGPGERGGITISVAGSAESALVPQGVPYALEVQSTLPVGAMLSHYDFGSATGESFTSEAPSATFFAGVDMRANVGVRSFLVWLAREDGDVRVTFRRGQVEQTVTVHSEELRRGGLALHELVGAGLAPDGYVDIIVQGLVTAAVTTYVEDFAPAAPGGDGYAVATLGVPGRAEMVRVTPLTYEYFIDLRDMVIPLVQRREGVEERIHLFNPGREATVVTLLLAPEGGAGDESMIVAGEWTVGAGASRVIDLAELEALADGGRYSLVIRSDRGVAAQHLRLNTEDAAGTRPAVAAATRWVFGEGFMDPARAGVNVFETLSIFNPAAAELEGDGADAEVSVLFRYTDGFVLELTYTLAAGRSLHLDVDDIEDVLDQGWEQRRYFYGLEIVSSVPVVAQLEHFDLTLGTSVAAGGFGTLGIPMGLMVEI